MKRHLNLLPLKMRLRLLVRTQLRRWAVVWCLAAMAGMVAWMQLDEELYALSNDADALKKKCQPILKTRRDHAKLLTEQSRITKRLDLIAKLQDPQAAFRLIGLISRSARACEGGIRVRDFWLSEDRVPIAFANPQPTRQARQPKRGRQKGTPKPTAEEAPKPEVKVTSRLVLQGVASDNLAVAKFVVALRESGAFDTVDLKSSMGASIRSRLRTYRIECVF